MRSWFVLGMALLAGSSALTTYVPHRVHADNLDPMSPPAGIPASVQPLISLPEVEPPRVQSAPTVAATPVGGRIVELIQRVQSTMTRTHYDHRTRIREREGVYLWDCSVMVAWMLARVAPTARARLNMERPLARDFYRAIETAPTHRARAGWQRVTHIEDVRPGDIFAWRRPRDWPPRNTGHTGFVLSTPTRMPGYPRAYLVRIADATSIPHADDSRAPTSGGGMGQGAVLFMTDGRGNVTHYGWHGENSSWIIQTPVLFGRVHR